jgi:hypothetical protein
VAHAAAFLSVVVAAGTLGATAAPAAGPSRHAYVVRVSSVCRTYARRLERIPAPSSPTAYGDVIASLERVVPLLRAQERAMRSVRAPSTLRLPLGRLFALDRQSIGRLGSALAAARRRDAAGVATGLARFSDERSRVHSLAVALGIDCAVN